MINELGEISTSGGVLLKMWEVIVQSGSRPLVRHSHIRFEITLITAGSGIYTVGDKKYAIKPYEIFVFASNEQHCVTEVGKDGLKMINLHFEPRYLWGRSFDRLSNVNTNFCFQHSPNFENCIPADRARQIRGLFTSAAEEFSKKGPEYAYQKLGYTKAAVIFKKGADYNEGLAENFVNEFESLGGTIVDQESYSEGDVDFKTQLTTILGKDPETVFCPNYYEEVGQILSQAESVGLTVPFLGGDGWDGLEGYASNDQLKDTYFCANYAKGSNSEFEDAYKAEYGQEYPNGFSPLGYDAAKTVVYGLQAAEDAGLEAGTDDYKQAVIDAIASGTIDGITGTFTFDEHHDPVKQTAILTYVDGKPVLKEMF